jgi:hypothetical protein
LVGANSKKSKRQGERRKIWHMWRLDSPTKPFFSARIRSLGSYYGMKPRIARLKEKKKKKKKKVKRRSLLSVEKLMLTWQDDKVDLQLRNVRAKITRQKAKKQNDGKMTIGR